MRWPSAVVLAAPALLALACGDKSPGTSADVEDRLVALETELIGLRETSDAQAEATRELIAAVDALELDEQTLLSAADDAREALAIAETAQATADGLTRVDYATEQWVEARAYASSATVQWLTEAQTDLDQRITFATAGVAENASAVEAAGEQTALVGLAVADLTSELSVVDARSRSTADTVGRLSATQSDLVVEVAAQDTRIEGFLADFDAASSEASTRMDELEATLDAAADERDTLQLGLDDATLAQDALSTRVADVESTVTRLSSEADTRAAELAQLATTTDDHGAQLTTLDQTAGALDAQLTLLDATVGDHGAQLLAVEAAVSTEAARVDAVDARVSQVESTVVGLESNDTAQDALLTGLSTGTSSLSGRVDVLETGAADVSAELADAAAERSSLVVAVSDHDDQIVDLTDEVLSLSADSAESAQFFDLVSVSGTDVVFDGANLHVRSGSGATDGVENGLGNVILGYNESLGGEARTGSHTLVVGMGHDWTGTSGLVVGTDHLLTGDNAVAIGGEGADVTGLGAVVVGGLDGTASGAGAVVVGGEANEASGMVAVVSGGVALVADGSAESLP